MAWIEPIAVVLGVLGVWLTIRQSIWCWPIGIVQVVLYIAIFYRVKLYSDVILQIIYVVLQVSGWWHWHHGRSAHGPLNVSRLISSHLIGWVVIALVGTVSWGWGMATFTDAEVPYWDAFIAVTSLIAQWLMTRKRLESWLFWLAVDLVAVGVYLSKALFLTSGLYAIFLVMAVMGFLAWRRSFAASLRDGIGNEDGTDTWEIRSSS